MHTISYCLMDETEYYYGPVHMKINNLKYETISKAIDKLLRDSQKEDCEPPHFLEYDEPRMWADDPPYYDNNDITKDLMNDGYYVWNRYQKYYVIAFAIDYTRFEFYSKDVDKRVIEWGNTCEAKNGPIKGVINNPNYNANPVIGLVQSLIAN